MMDEFSEEMTQRVQDSQDLAATEGKGSGDHELARIAAFDLVTDALKCIDEYQQGKNDALSEAETLLTKALAHDPGNFRANYLLAIVNCLINSELFRFPGGLVPPQMFRSQRVIVKEVVQVDASARKTIESLYRQWEDLPTKAPNSRIMAEAYYNLATIEYQLMLDHKTAAAYFPETETETDVIDRTENGIEDISSKAIGHFKQARDSSSTNHDLRLASSIGELAARLERYDKEDIGQIEQLKAQIDRDLPDNFILRIVRPNSASRKLTRWARETKQQLAFFEQRRRDSADSKGKTTPVKT